MGKCKKMFAVALTCLLFGGLAFAGQEYTIPKDSRNDLPGDINMVGVNMFAIPASSVSYIISESTFSFNNGSQSTGRPVTITSPETPVVVYGVMFSTEAFGAPGSNYVTFSDTTTAGRSATWEVYPAIWVPDSLAQIVTFPQPLIFKKACCVSVGVAGTAPSGKVTILYRLRKGKN